MSRKRQGTPLQRLLYPRHVAVFGGRAAEEVIRQCRRIGFQGEIWAVNPTRDELCGIPCVRSVAELPAPPDASFVAAPAALSVQLVEELAHSGAGGVVLFSSGFAELNEEGSLLQNALREAAGEMALVGPNCHGTLNFLDGVALWPDSYGGERVEKGVALITQSGNIAINLTMQQRGLPIAQVIAVGNKATLGFHDYIHALLDDERITAIGLHIEGLTDVDAFSAAAIAALRKGVPIVALKAGRSQLGAALTLSHTSSLAGRDEACAALFHRVGIARCDTLAEFIESLKFLSVIGPLPGDRLASLSCSGGEASLVADQAETLSIPMPALSQDSATTLAQLLGPRVHISNPLDYHLYAWGDEQKLQACFGAVMASGYDCTILVLDYPGGDADTSLWEAAERALVGASTEQNCPAAVVATLPENFPREARERLKAAGVAPMQGIQECLRAVGAAALIGRARQRVDEMVPVHMVGPLSAARAVTVDEWASKRLLREHGVPVPLGALCSAEEAPAAAVEIGFPVVVKAVSSSIAHKSEAGAVRLSLHDQDSVRAAVADMSGLSAQFLVERMMPAPVAELIVGVQRDDAFGLLLAVGAGGTLVELLRDSATLLLPVSRSQIASALDGLRIARLLSGYRGVPAGDRERLLDAIESIASFALAHSSSLLELDVNPLMVLPAGQGVVAVDALLRIASDE